MGMTLMADDRDLIIGEVREAVRAIRDHLKRQDDQQILRDQQTEINKREAIKAREEKDARDEGRFRVLDEKTSLTGGRVQVLEEWKKDEGEPLVKWYAEEGSKLGRRVSTLEQAELDRVNAKRLADIADAKTEGVKTGKTWMITKIIALITAIAAVLGWIGAEKLGALFVQMGVKLGG
jgi:hypothetical protein